jgi:hypothetical protein
MSKLDPKIEQRIADALCAYHDRGKPKIAPLAREFNISYQQLKGRVQGRQSRTARTPSNRALDEGQEKALIAWMRILDRANLSPLPYEIEGAANDILSRSGSDRRVGKNWVYRFMARLPNTFKCQTQKTSIPRTPPPASSSTINSPPTTIQKLQKNIIKARESFPDIDSPEMNKLKRRVERIWEGSVIQAHLAAQVSADLIRYQENQEQANAKKTKR